MILTNCVALLLILLVPAAAADDNAIFVIDNSRNQSSAGGHYTPVAHSRCHNETVWMLNDQDGTAVRQDNVLYLLRHDDGYWVVSPEEDCSTERAVLRSLLPARDNVVINPTWTGPAEIDWTRSVYGVWMFDTAIRVRTRGCSNLRGCLQMNCQEPDEGDSCTDCTLDGASMDCSSTSNIRTYFLVIILAILGIAVLVSVAWLLYRYRAVVFRRRDASCSMAQLGCTISRKRKTFLVVTIASALLLAATGLPLAQVRTHGNFSTDWAPQGGVLERELDFVDKWTESSKQRSKTILMVGNKGNKNALTRTTAMSMLRILQDIAGLKITAAYDNGTETSLGMHDFCGSTDMKLEGMAGLPCYVPSILDCFIEGAWLMDDVIDGKLPPQANWSLRHQLYRDQYDMVKDMGVESAIMLYDGRPSITNVTEEEFRQIVSGYPNQCQHWVRAASRSKGYLLGNMEEDSNGILTGATKLNAMMMAYAPDRAKYYKAKLEGMSVRSVDEALNEWYDKASERIEEINDDEENYPGIETSVFMTSSPSKMFKEISQARAEQLIIGIIIIFAVAVVTQFSRDKTKSFARAAIIGVFLVILSNLAAYGFISLVGIKLNHAMLQALPFLALGLGVDDMFLLMHYFREVPDKNRPTEEVIADLYREGGVSVTLTSICNAGAFFSGMLVPIPALSDFLAAAGVIVVFNFVMMFLAFPVVLAWECDNLKKRQGSDDSPKSCFTCAGLVHDRWIPFVQNKCTQYTAAGLSAFLFVWFIVSLSVLFPLKFGSDMTDLTPKGSFLAKGFSDVDKYLLSQRQEHVFCMKKSAVDITSRHGQFIVERFYKLIATNGWTNDEGYNEETKLFVHHYFTYLQGSMTGTVWEPTGTNHTSKDYMFTEYDKLWYSNDTVMQRFHTWRNPLNSPIYATTSQTTDGFGMKWGTESYDADNTIEYWNFPYSLDKTKLNDMDDWIEHVDDFHDYADAFFGEEQAFPSPSAEYLQVMEFMSLRKYFTQSFIIASVIIFVCCMLLSVSLRGALIITLVSVCGTLEVAAFIMMCGLHFSSLVAVTLLMSIGMFVEFSAHVVVGYESSVGTRQRRLAHCISKTFLPVLEGGVSSLLSFAMLAMSQFPYVFKYFFLVFLVVILVGLLHGLFLVPALLGLVGTVEGGTAKRMDDEEEVSDVCAGAALNGKPSDSTNAQLVAVTPGTNPLAGRRCFNTASAAPIVPIAAKKLVTTPPTPCESNLLPPTRTTGPMDVLSADSEVSE